MNYLSVENLTKYFVDFPLFENLTFGISQGEKVALVGKNGSGKTTLMRILAGLEAPDSGEVVLRNGVSLGYLPQMPVFEENQSVHAYIFDESNKLLHTIAEYEQAITTGTDQDTMQRLIEEMENLKAWDYEAQVKEILGKVGIYDLDKNVRELSGGQRKRVSIAKSLIENPDFLILDEPTNHLDLEVIEWLEQYLGTRNMTLLLVTHDRYFLDNVCNKIIELEDARLYQYQGNYSYFLEKKDERERQQMAEIEKAQNIFRKELDWIRRQPKARGTKAKYRVEAFEAIKEKAHEKTERTDVQFKAGMQRLGNKILEISHLNKSFGDKVLIRDFNYTFKKRDRIGIIGENGTGKTTLLNILTGGDQNYSGSLEIGSTVKFGYFKQEEFNFPQDKRVIDIVKDIAEVIELANGSTISAGQFLQHFLFTPEMQYTYVGKLSGGEKKRLQLLTVLVKAPNFLILDEPTNDLDIFTLSRLEEYLMHFEGCLLVVSHDRYFMDRLVDHSFVFEGDGFIRDFPGNYSHYRAFAEANAPIASSKKEHPRRTPEHGNKSKDTQKNRLTFKEKREFEALEKSIESLESKKLELVEKMNAGEAGHQQMTEWGQEIETITKEIEEKSTRWMELAEYAEE